MGTEVDWDKHVRRSRATTLVSASGVLIGLGALTYGMVSLSRVEEARGRLRIEAKQAQTDLAEANSELNKAVDQLAEVERVSAKKVESLALLRVEVAELERAKQTLAEEVGVSERQLEVARRESRAVISEYRKSGVVPAWTAITPRASATALEGQGAADDGRPLYRISMWVEMPSELRPKIDSITYVMNHPSFATPRLQGDPDDDFRVQYIGWGCLPTVIVECRSEDGSVVELDFDQCAAFSESLPNKGGLPVKAPPGPDSGESNRNALPSLRSHLGGANDVTPPVEPRPPSE